MKYLLLTLCYFFILFTKGAVAEIIDHTSLEKFDNINQEQTDKGRQLNILFSHRSVGRIIMYGLQDLGNQDSKYLLNFMPEPEEWQNDVSINDYINYGPIFGHQNQDSFEEFFNFAAENDAVIDVGIVKWCYVDMYGTKTAQKRFEEYKNYVVSFKANNPDVVLVHCTMPLTTDTDALNAERSKYRDLILAEYGTSGDYIFDIAAIESWYNNALTKFNYNGTDYLRMHDAYTDDGGHPNETGRMPLAKGIWILLVDIANGFRTR